jgi:hypothetical protein
VLEIRDKASFGVTFDHWLVWYGEPMPREELNDCHQLCVVAIREAGAEALYLRRIAVSADGQHHLIAPSGDGQFHQMIVWAAKVLAMTPPSGKP